MNLLSHSCGGAPSQDSYRDGIMSSWASAVSELKSQISEAIPTASLIWVIGFLFKRKRKEEPNVPVEVAQKLEPNNPKGRTCPKCRGRNLIVAEDNSAFCIDCNVGFMNVSGAGKAKPLRETATAEDKSP